MADIKIGDLVRLKSGGPVMTVNRMLGNGITAECSWFVEKDVKTAQFSPDALQLEMQPK